MVAISYHGYCSVTMVSVMSPVEYSVPVAGVQFMQLQFCYHGYSSVTMVVQSHS